MDEAIKYLLKRADSFNEASKLVKDSDTKISILTKANILYQMVNELYKEQLNS